MPIYDLVRFGVRVPTLRWRSFLEEGVPLLLWGTQRDRVQRLSDLLTSLQLLAPEALLREEIGGD